MDASETQALIQPYLDRQLEPALAEALTARLAADVALARLLEAERRFHEFLRRILADVPVPAGLQERIHGRLSGGQVHAPLVRRSGTSWLRRGYAGVAAVLVFGLIGIVFYEVLCPGGRCRYMDAACTEHLEVLRGRRPLTVASSDATTLARYVQGRLRHPVTAVPDLGGFSLAPTGAGTASFGKLRPVGAPEAVFIEYEDAGRAPVTLLLHEWPSETPSVPLTEHAGRRFWCAEYDGVSAVCWKNTDQGVLCSVVAQKPKADLLRIALEARDALER